MALTLAWLELIAQCSNLDLSTVKDRTVIHQGPRHRVDTIYRSGGNISQILPPEAQGVPLILITYMRSLVGKPLEFYSCS